MKWSFIFGKRNPKTKVRNKGVEFKLVPPPEPKPPTYEIFIPEFEPDYNLTLKATEEQAETYRRISKEYELREILEWNRESRTTFLKESFMHTLLDRAGL